MKSGNVSGRRDPLVVVAEAEVVEEEEDVGLTMILVVQGCVIQAGEVEAV